MPTQLFLTYLSIMELIVERLKDTDNWDEELEYFGGGLFMTSTWLSVISNINREPVYFRFIENNKPVAVIGGIEFYIKKKEAKQLLFYSKIAAKNKDPEFIRRCKIALYQYARKNGSQRISIRSYDNHSYVDARVKQFKERKCFEYAFHFENNKEELIKGFDRDLRRRARKTKREGVVLKNSYSPELTDSLLRLIDETYNVRQSKGYGAYNYLYLPFISRNEIERLVKKRYGSFYFAEKESKILSIQLIVSSKKKAYSILMGTSNEGYRAGAPSFLFYELALLFKDQGYSYLNLGGVSHDIKHLGLKKFKDSLGADVIASADEVTNFLSPPLIFINPILDLARFIRNSKYFPEILIEPANYAYNLIMKGRNKY